ncbi:MAG: hypothetical protein P8Y70_15645 [Candidatus Lokiarchaeota archaeon]
MPLDALGFLTGLFNLIFVIISIAVGLIIISKYKQANKKRYIYLGLIWIGISTPWMHGAIAFILLFFNITFDPIIRFIIGYAFIPIITTIWIAIFTDLLYENKKKILVSIYMLISIICEILFFIFLFVDRVELIGYFETTFQARYSLFIRFTMVFFLISALITFLIFARHSLKSNDPVLKIKGKFLIIAFLTYSVCAVLDSFTFFIDQ